MIQIHGIAEKSPQHFGGNTAMSAILTLWESLTKYLSITFYTNNSDELPWLPAGIVSSCRCVYMLLRTKCTQMIQCTEQISTDQKNGSCYQESKNKYTTGGRWIEKKWRPLGCTPQLFFSSPWLVSILQKRMLEEPCKKHNRQCQNPHFANKLIQFHGIFISQDSSSKLNKTKVHNNIKLITYC